MDFLYVATRQKNCMPHYAIMLQRIHAYAAFQEVRYNDNWITNMCDLIIMTMANTKLHAANSTAHSVAYCRSGLRGSCGSVNITMVC